WATCVRAPSPPPPRGRRVGSAGGYPGERFETALAGVLVLFQAPTQASGQQGVALVGTAGDELVALGQHHMAPGPVDVAPAPAHGEHVEAGVDVELQVLEGGP